MRLGTSRYVAVEGCGTFFAEERKGALKGARDESRCARVGRRTRRRESSDASGEGERGEYRYERGSNGAGALVESAKRRGGWREARPMRNAGTWAVVFVSLHSTVYLCQLSFLLNSHLPWTKRNDFGLLVLL